MELTIENAHLFLEDFELERNPPKAEAIRDPNKCQECDGELQYVNHFLTCVDCGLTDLDKCQSIAMESSDEYIPKRSLYRRKLYALDKLRMLNAQKTCKKPIYKTAIDKLRTSEFSTIHELKKLMKEHKYNKLYPYIYLIYHEIKQVKLIDLDWRQIDRIADEFVKMEIKFKTSEKTSKRKNMLSYNVMIYMIMKDLNYKGYDHILLPQNYKYVKKLA